MNYSTHTRHSGITQDQFFALCDDTRHLVSSTATCKLGIDDAPARITERPRPAIVNIDTAPDQIDNRAEADALIADIDALIAELDAAELDAIESPTPAVESTPAVIESTPAPEKNQDKQAESSLISIDSLTPDIAPAFRGYAPLPERNTGRAYTPADTERLVRVQVADLEWLYRSGYRVQVDSPKYRDMLTGEQFDGELAEQFAREKWRIDHKLALLCVPERLQLELTILRTKAVADKLRNARKAVESDRTALTLSVGDDKRIDLNEWCSLRLCEKLVGAGKPRPIAALYEKMTGRTIDRANVSRKLSSIGERLKRK